MTIPKKRKLGRTDIEVSELGFGAWPIGGNMYGPVADKEAMACVEAYLENGGNFIDTARRYGESEKILGQVFQKTGKRDQVVLASKTFMGEEAATIPKIREELELTLKLLRTDYLDLYYLHMPPGEPDVMDAALDEFEALKKEGKIRSIGASIKGPAVTSATHELCKRYIESGRIDVIQLVYSILRQSNQGIFDLAAQNGVGLVARTAIESGFLSGKYKPGFVFTESHRKRWPAEVQQEIFEKVIQLNETVVKAPFQSLTEVAVKFSLAPPEISSVIVGARDVGQLKANMNIAALPDLDASVVANLLADFENATEQYNPK